MPCKLFQHRRITLVLRGAGAIGQTVAKRQHNPVAGQRLQFCSLRAACQEAEG